MDLNTRIRRELGDGKAPDQIVAELTAAGMTEATAWRHVHRAMGAPEPPPSSAATNGSKDATGKSELVQGVFLISLTGCVAGLVALGEVTGRVPTRGYLLAVFGAVQLIRGLYKWSKVQDRVPFPFVFVLWAALLPAITTGSLAGVARWFSHRRAVAQQVAQAPAPPETPGPPKWTELVEGRSIADAHHAAISSDPNARCRAAHDYGVREMIEASGTLQRLAQDSDARVRKCALDAFAVWLRSEVVARRRVAVSSLDGVGRDADPLLRQVAANENEAEELRKLANAFLERHGAQPARQPDTGLDARRLYFGRPEERCKATTEIGERELVGLGTALATVMTMDADLTVRKCARDAFVRMLRSEDPRKRHDAILSVGTTGRGGWDLLQQAADTDPIEENRKLAADVLAWRKREAAKTAQAQGTTRNP